MPRAFERREEEPKAGDEILACEHVPDNAKVDRSLGVKFNHDPQGNKVLTPHLQYIRANWTACCGECFSKGAGDADKIAITRKVKWAGFKTDEDKRAEEDARTADEEKKRKDESARKNEPGTAKEQDDRLRPGQAPASNANASSEFLSVVDPTKVPVVVTHDAQGTTQPPPHVRAPSEGEGGEPKNQGVPPVELQDSSTRAIPVNQNFNADKPHDERFPQANDFATPERIDEQERRMREGLGPNPPVDESDPAKSLDQKIADERPSAETTDHDAVEGVEELIPNRPTGDEGPGTKKERDALINPPKHAKHSRKEK